MPACAMPVIVTTSPVRYPWLAMVTTAGFVWRISVLLLASPEPDSMKKAEPLKGVVAPWDIQVFPKRKSDKQKSADVALRPVRIRVCPSAVQRIQRQPRWPRRPPAASPPGRRSRAVEIELQPVDILVGCTADGVFRNDSRKGVADRGPDSQRGRQNNRIAAAG